MKRQRKPPRHSSTLLFVRLQKASGKPWYFTEILELERLKELPAGLTR